MTMMVIIIIIIIINRLFVRTAGVMVTHTIACINFSPKSARILHTKGKNNDEQVEITVTRNVVQCST